MRTKQPTPSARPAQVDQNATSETDVKEAVGAPPERPTPEPRPDVAGLVEDLAVYKNAPEYWAHTRHDLLMRCYAALAAQAPAEPPGADMIPCDHCQDAHAPPACPQAQAPAAQPDAETAAAFIKALDGIFAYLSVHGWVKPIAEISAGMDLLKRLASPVPEAQPLEKKK